MPKMTRKDFEFIASTLAFTRPPAAAPYAVRYQWYGTVIEFGERLGETNPQFSLSRFMEAAGVQHGILNEV